MPAPDTVDEFSSLERRCVDHVLDLSPGYGVLLGLHSYDGRLPDLSRSSTERWCSNADRLLEELRGVGARELPADRQVDRQLLELLLEGSLFDLRDAQEYDRNPMNFLGGLSLSAYTVRAYAPLAERGEAMLRTLEAIPRFLEAAQQRLRPVLPLPFLTLASSIGSGLPGHYAECEETLRVELPALADRFHAVRGPAETAILAFLKRLEEEFRPRATPEFSLGPVLYERLLWVREGVRRTPAELRAEGERDLRRNQARLEALVQEMRPGATVRTVLDSVTADHGGAEDLLPTARKYVAETEEWVRRSAVVSLPEPAVCRVEETPAYSRALSTASMDPPGPFETTGDDGVYYVTPVDPTWAPERQQEWLRSLCRPFLRNITVHEVFPGHYLQFLHLRRSRTSLARKVSLSASFTEGWAHYCEQLAIEQGFGGESRANELVQLQDALLRDCRLLVSVGLHTSGWSVAQGTAFFQKEAFMEQLPAEREAMRGTFNPEYFCYTLGKLEILRARAKYAGPEAGGLRAFHDRLLSFGSPPVGLIDGLLAGR